MADKFKVLRPHIGDRMYASGETREAEAADVAHLVARGVLQAPKGKAEPKAENKAEPKAENKAEPKAENKPEGDA